ncbi:creatininase family protein [Halorubrum sp. CGM5_25_10-8B]|uniref:creatininase family protein n=1 Tax=Halorubrum sp. CGM5_25_10-8B TaxID=2518115 RepID=UPI0010F4B57E|nr:creatininase family protein [Halorubrum sp. CGM5_25_10-8B]TKX37604.1 creatininase family protein [Halorubrum sp. CGM5_25_10-8B]
MTDTHKLEELSWPAVEQYITDRESPTVIVPIGSTEQHGPHLPLAVDAYQARELATEIAVAADVLTAPLIPYGDANHHLGFPGTISLSTETVVSVLTDVYASLAGHGFENIITVNGHRIANLPAIRTAMQQAAAQCSDTSFAAIDPLRFGVSIHEQLREGDPEDGMHGGEFETSFMLARYPELVDTSAFEKASADPGPHSTLNLIGNDDRVITPSTGHSPTDGDPGHVGDPTLATATKGEELWAELVANAAEFVEAIHGGRQ